MLTPTMPTARVIKHQFRRGGVIHLALVHDSVFDGQDGMTLHVTHPYETFCGKNIPIGTGGWGYGGRKCETCHKFGGREDLGR
jgi:hypothetical protein